MVSLATGPLDRFGYVWHLRNGEHPRARRRHLAARPARSPISGEDFFLAADGEISGPERRRSWHLEQAAYSMIVP